MAKGKFIQKALNPDNKGKLRKALHAKVGSPIPEAKLEKAAHSKNPTMRKRAVLARTLRGLRKVGPRKGV